MNRLAVLIVLAVGAAAACGREPPKAPEGIWVTDVGSGPVTVIMLHGGPGMTHRYLRPEWDRLADEARVVYYDQRGCGWSERTDSVSWERHTADLDSIVTSLRSEAPIVLAGSSWGSVLAVLYAYSHPGTVSALILSGVPDLRGWFLPIERGLPQYLLDTMLAAARSHESPSTPSVSGIRVDSKAVPSDSTVLSETDSTSAATKKPRTAEAIIQPQPVTDSAQVAADSFAVLPALAARMGMACPSTLPALRSSISETGPALDSLARIQTPTLIVRGDSITGVGDGSKELAEVLPNAQVVTIEGAGHDPWFEQPASFFEVVVDFLRGCSVDGCGT